MWEYVFFSEDAAGFVHEHLIGEEPLHVTVLLASGIFCVKATQLFYQF
jgi:hypothetical protein